MPKRGAGRLVVVERGLQGEPCSDSNTPSPLRQHHSPPALVHDLALADRPAFASAGDVSTLTSWLPVT